MRPEAGLQHGAGNYREVCLTRSDYVGVNAGKQNTFSQ